MGPYDWIDAVLYAHGEYAESAEAAALRRVAWEAIIARLTPTQRQLCALRLEGMPLTACAAELELTYEAARWQRQLIAEIIKALL